MHARHGHARNAQEHRPLVDERVAHRGRGLHGIGRNNHGEVGEHTHPGEIFNGVMRGPKLAVSHTRRHGAELYVRPGVRKIDLDLLHGARGKEARRAANVRDHTAIGQPRAHAHHVLLGDADIDEAVRELLFEILELRRGERIVGHGAHACVGSSHLFEGAHVGVAAVEDLLAGCGGRWAAHQATSTSSSFAAMASCSLVGTP